MTLETRPGSRDFHAYFIDLANRLACKDAILIMTVILFGILSYEVKGGFLTVSQAIIIMISISQHLCLKATTMADELSAMVPGYIALRNIAAVLNAKSV